MKSILLILAAAFSITANANQKYSHPHQLIVKANKSLLENKSLNFGFSLKALTNSKNKSDDQVFLLELNNLVLADKALEDIRSMPQVSWAAPNYVYEGEYREFVPNDSFYNKQFHHKLIQSEKAWDVSLGKEEVIIAVTDDGFQLDHLDLKDSWWKNPEEIPGNQIDDDGNGYVDDVIGWNFNNSNNDPSSDYNHGGHGTHVAGIVGAGFDNNKGVTGMSPMIKVMPLKFYGSQRWTSAMVFETYAYAVDNGAKVITTSYNIDWFVGDETYLKALDYAYARNVIVFNSAGNSGKEDPKRIVFKKLILVGSVQSGEKISKHDKKSRFSNYGVGIDVFAPGDPIYSTVRRGKFSTMNGTSMAAPAAAALSAYIWSVYPEYTMDQVLSKLMMSSDEIDSKNSRYTNKLGNGRVNAFRAISEDVPAAPRISKVWYDRNTKMLNMLLNGVLDRHEIQNSQVIIEGESKVSKLTIDSYELGTNILEFKFEEKGKYEVVLKDGQLKDPFGQALDGNADGASGGEFRHKFKVY